jgi:hypothetical protein
MAHRKRPVLRCGVGHRRGEVDAADFETFNGYIGKVLSAMVDRDETAEKTRERSGAVMTERGSRFGNLARVLEHDRGGYVGSMKRTRD